MVRYTLRRVLWACAAIGLAATASTGAARAQAVSCPVNYAQLRQTLVTADQNDTTGFNNHFWAVVVNREGVVCQVAYSGADAGSQWLASRQIAAAKAFTANGLSLNVGTGGTTALSTAQLYQFVQPDNANVANPLYGLAGGNVLNSVVAYQGSYAAYGTPSDPMIGYRVGGTITFGGGLALYQGGTVVGGLGLSGDTACADHSVAWLTRIFMQLVPPGSPDALHFASNPGQPDGHPHCPNDSATRGVQ